MARFVLLIVFTGANAPTTIDRFPRGEAVHYRERALAAGVPDEAIRVEPKARNTGENVTLTRELLAEEGSTAKSVMLISRPYQERRAYATCRKVWPEVEVVCTSQQVDLDTYAAGIGDIARMINVMNCSLSAASLTSIFARDSVAGWVVLGQADLHGFGGAERGDRLFGCLWAGSVLE